MSEADRDSREQRAFWGLLGFVAVALFIAVLAAAPRAYFSEDDFRWLAVVRAPDFSLIDAWFPYAQREWWAYRPISMHSYWYVGQALFGFEPTGFLWTSITLHFAGGLLAYRLAWRLGFPRPVAGLTALLAVSRAPSLDVLYWASAFNYFSVAFASLASLVWQAEGLARRSGDGRVPPAWRAGSALWLGVALLCQESALFLPPVLFGLSWLSIRESGAEPRAALRPALLASWPHFAIAVVFAIQRFVLIAPFPRHANYQSVFGANVPRNLYDYTRQVVGGDGLLWALLAAGVALALWAARRPDWRRAWTLRVLPRLVLGVVWLAACLVPFSAVRLGAPRFAVAAELPASFLVGGLFACAWFVAAPSRRPWLGLGLLVGVIASFPYGGLAAAYEAPRGQGARVLLSEIEALSPALAQDECLVVVYGEEGLATDAWWLQREAWSGTPMLAARHPGGGHRLVFRRPDRPVQADDFAPSCRWLGLTSDVHLVSPSAAQRRALLEAGLGSASPRVVAAAAERFAFDFGAEAVTPLVALATPGSPVAEALLLIEDPRARRAADTLVPDAAQRDEARMRLRARWAQARPRR